MHNIEQGSLEWFEQRMGNVTASRISSVLMTPATKGYQDYQGELICERLTGQMREIPTTFAMQHGIETEPQARLRFEIETGFTVKDIAFVSHPKITNSGASPDGLVGEDGLLEIKCPQPFKHTQNLLETDENVDKKYLDQIQWQLACTNRKWCDLVSFSFDFPVEMQLTITRIDRDDTYISEMENKVTTFLEEVDAKIEALTLKFQKDAA